ncbi:hypothetical protein BH10PSE7_BH10PSE7_12470 [soil metagenome]
MSVRTLTSSDFHATVEAAATLVVEFAEDRLDISEHPLSARFSEVCFTRCDPVKEPAVARMFGITASPVTLIFRERIVLFLEPVTLAPDKLATLLDAIIGLDMRVVRDRLEKERSENSVHMQRMCPAARRGRLV